MLVGNAFQDELKIRILAKGWSVAEAAHQLGVATKTIRRWQSGENGPNRPELMSALKQCLGFTQIEIERYLAVWAQRKDQVESKSFSELLGSGQEIEDLEEQLHQIEDGEFPVPIHDDEEYGQPENWASVYKNCQQTGTVIFDRNQEIGAHWLFVPVNSDLIDRGLLGENINRTFSMLDVRSFFAPGTYDVYFVSLFIRRHFNNSSGNSYVLFSIQDKMLELAEDGFFIQRMFGNMSSIDMVSLALSLGFEFVCDHQEHRMKGPRGTPIPTQILQADLRNPSTDRILEHTPRLLGLYQDWRKSL